MHDFLLWPIIGNRGILISSSETCFYHDCNLAIEGTATICLVASSPCIRFNVIYTACSFIIGWCLLVTQERTLLRIGTLQKSRKTQYIAMHQWPKSLCAWNTVYCNITQQQDIFHKAHIPSLICIFIIAIGLCHAVQNERQSSFKRLQQRVHVQRTRKYNICCLIWCLHKVRNI